MPRFYVFLGYFCLFVLGPLGYVIGSREGGVALGILYAIVFAIGIPFGAGVVLNILRFVFWLFSHPDRDRF